MKNPLGVTGIGDPFILYDDGKYYMYATSLGNGYRVWVSDTCAKFQPAGIAYQQSGTSFGFASYWAPEVYKYEGKFYMFYSALYKNKSGQERFGIGVAVADTPVGPFTDLVPNQALFAPSYSVIDANVLFDDNGKVYLYYSKDCSTNSVNGNPTSQIFGVEISSDFKTVIGEPVLLSTPDAAWESRSGSWRWNEGPCVFKRGDTYYMMYSAGYYENNTYAVGYSTSDSPLGPFKKFPLNPILVGDGINTSGTGHNNYFFSPDGTEMFAVYHSHTVPSEGGGNRQLCIDRMIFDEKGVLSISGPTLRLQPAPSGTNGSVTLKSDAFTLSVDEGVKSVSGSSALLFDQVIQIKSGKSTKDSWIIRPGENSLTLTIKQPQELVYLALYTNGNHTSFAKSITLIINGTYRIPGVSMLQTMPTVFSFDSLPEGTVIETLTLSFEMENEKDSVALTEIFLVGKSS
ncbi:MAG: hypothetical protein E7618_02000 [Ruminococcaceae bacterium]|nr:hypothetical protein [Oscillospiraceae bacterium]